jgi:phosphoribosylglycinamide formyltransferase 1
MRVGFLASHRGSSAQAIWTASKAGEIAVEPCVLICNNSGSDALSWARSVGLEAHHLSGQTHPDSDQLDAAITQVLDGEAVDVVVLSGYMKKLGPRTLRRFPNRILNIHPALLPHFGGHGMYGIRVHEAVIDAGATTTGISVHLVDADYDTGPVLYQTRIAVRHGETPEQLQQRVASHEPDAYLRTLRLIFDGEINLDHAGEDQFKPIVEDIAEQEYADLLAFRRSLPAKRMGAGLLVRDAEGRVMLVEPTYKDAWEIPGGVIDEDESPRECVIREVREELGLEVEPGRLLVVDYQHPEPDRTESVMFVFDGGVIGEEATSRVVLQEQELRSWRFIDVETLKSTASSRLGRRLLHVLKAVADGQTLYLENGQLPSNLEDALPRWQTAEG